MARIAGVDIPDSKRVDIGLRHIYGVGPAISRDILAQASISPDTKVKDLTKEELTHIREVIDSDHKVEGELRKELAFNIKRLMEIGSYRGIRHRRRLPARGQRTKTNARTKRGARQTIAGRGRRRGVAKK